MRNPTSGFAIALVLLFACILLASAVLTTSTVVYGSRNSTSRETQSYQALLAAESGLNTFVARVKEGGFNGTMYDLPCWVQGQALGGVTCPTGSTRQLTTLYLTNQATGPRADVDLVAMNGAQATVTVRSVGTLGSGFTAAQSTVIQQIRLVKPPFMNVSAPAALTSCPDISGGGTSNLSGTATNFSGVIPNFTVVTAASPATVSTQMATAATTGWPVSLTVSDASALDVGSFVRIGGGTQAYRVVSKTGSTALSVIPADGTAANLPPAGTALTGSLSLIPFALRAAPTENGTTSGSTPVYRLPISDPTGVYPRDVLYFNVGGTVYGVTVVSKGFANGDLAQGYVDVTLGATGAGRNLYNASTGAQLTGTVPTPSASMLANLPLGSAFRRYVPGGASGNRVQNLGSPNSNTVVPSTSWQGASTVSPAAIAGSTSVPCGDALFAQTFNDYTKTQVYNLTPIANRLSAISGPLSRGLYWLGPQATPSSSTFTLNANDLCGFGILVVNGDLNMKGTGNLNAGANQCTSNGDGTRPKGFNGLIYVIGNYANQGNSSITGAIVVEGRASGPLASSLGGGMTINYDQRYVLQSATVLSPVTFNAVDGTWGQQ